ncbi:MAG: hypothetical protein ACO3UU_16360, partial [Minisyncoccia bacterium]
MKNIKSFFNSLFPDNYPIVSSKAGSYLFEENSITGNISTIGKIIRIDDFTDYFYVTLLGNNVVNLDPNGSYIISPNGRLDNPDIFTFSMTGDLSIEYTYFRGDDNLRKLVRDKSSKIRSLSNLRVDDSIKIDGESDYRKITRIPEFVHLKDFRNEKEVSNQIYGKVGATNYNGFAYGSGLGITANIENGSVVSLDWNKRDIQLFVDNDIKDKETAIGYYTPPILNFIPENENGGGAQAEVLVVNKSVVDIIITNPGSGYTKPPKVVVSRRYKRIKENRKIDYITFFSISPKINVDNIVIFTSIDSFNEPNVDVITSESTVGFIDTPIERQITEIVQVQSAVSISSLIKTQVIVY